MNISSQGPLTSPNLWEIIKTFGIYFTLLFSFLGFVYNIFRERKGFIKENEHIIKELKNELRKAKILKDHIGFGFRFGEAYAVLFPHSKIKALLKSLSSSSWFLRIIFFNKVLKKLKKAWKIWEKEEQNIRDYAKFLYEKYTNLKKKISEKYTETIFEEIEKEIEVRKEEIRNMGIKAINPDKLSGDIQDCLKNKRFEIGFILRIREEETLYPFYLFLVNKDVIRFLFDNHELYICFQSPCNHSSAYLYKLYNFKRAIKSMVIEWLEEYKTKNEKIFDVIRKIEEIQMDLYKSLEKTFPFI